MRRARACCDGVASDRLPPAHIGIHAGPVMFQEGDYFGRTVNAASRIADHAGRDQVLVSQDVVDAAPLDDVRYDPIGPVELQGPARPAAPRTRSGAPGLTGQRNAPSGRADGA